MKLAKTFAENVYEVVADIPKGQTLSYKEVAALAGRPHAYRAVGNILNKNRNPAVPCHRVIKSDGSIGGYAWGTAKKIAILKKEGYAGVKEKQNTASVRQQAAMAHSVVVKVRHATKVLSVSFFRRPVLKVAPDLLGKFLVRRIGRKKIALPITEVEAYDGPHDKACHAHKGKTARTAPMFGRGGRFYVYFCYGIHWMLNIVTGPKNYPAAILIRAAGAVNGPAKLTRFLKINKSLNNKEVSPENGLWFEDRGLLINKKQIKRHPRIGVDYAGPVWEKNRTVLLYPFNQLQFHPGRAAPGYQHENQGDDPADHRNKTDYMQQDYSKYQCTPAYLRFFVLFCHMMKPSAKSDAGKSDAKQNI